MQESLQELRAPETPEQQERYQKNLRQLRQKKYISGKLEGKLVELILNPPRLYTPLEARAPSTATITPARVPTQPKRKSIEDYLLDPLKLSAAEARKYAYALTLEQVEDLYDKLALRVGEQAAELLRFNPEILLYREQGILATYLKVLQQVVTKIGTSPALQEHYGIASNLGIYSRLENLLELKRELYKTAAPEEAAPAFDLETYKSKLLKQAGLDVEVTRAIAESKNKFYIGEYYMPMQYFRKNAYGKAPEKMDLMFPETFERLKREGAIVRKDKAYHFSNLKHF